MKAGEMDNNGGVGPFGKGLCLILSWQAQEATALPAVAYGGAPIDSPDFHFPSVFMLKYLLKPFF